MHAFHADKSCMGCGSVAVPAAAAVGAAAAAAVAAIVAAAAAAAAAAGGAVQIEFSLHPCH
jgi:hypothetical protein